MTFCLFSTNWAVVYHSYKKVLTTKRSMMTSKLFALLKCLIFATSLIWEMARVDCQILDTETVTIQQGVLRGGSKLLNGQRIFNFLGVPYAEPPVGNRRLRPTSPHPGWTVCCHFSVTILIPTSKELRTVLSIFFIAN